MTRLSDAFGLELLGDSPPHIRPVHRLSLLSRLHEHGQRPLVIILFHTLPSRRQPVYQYAGFTRLHERGTRVDSHGGTTSEQDFLPGQSDHNRGFACASVIATDAGSRLTLRASGRPHRCVEADLACARRCQRRGRPTRARAWEEMCPTAFCADQRSEWPGTTHCPLQPRDVWLRSARCHLATYVGARRARQNEAAPRLAFRHRSPRVANRGGRRENAPGSPKEIAHTVAPSNALPAPRPPLL